MREAPSFAPNWMSSEWATGCSCVSSLKPDSGGGLAIVRKIRTLPRRVRMRVALLPPNVHPVKHSKLRLGVLNCRSRHPNTLNCPPPTFPFIVQRRSSAEYRAKGNCHTSTCNGFMIWRAGRWVWNYVDTFSSFHTMKAALDVKTARACFTAIDADGFSQATCELLSAGVDQVRGD